MNTLKTLTFIGATLTIVGSFLPWERGGGFLGPITNGLRVDLANLKYWVTGIHEFPIYDYGGVLVVLLTLAIILLAFRPPRFINDPILGNLIVSAILMASSLFFVGRGLIHRYEFGSRVEPPTLMIGLGSVVLGSALLLWMAIMTYRWVTYRHLKIAG